MSWIYDAHIHLSDPEYKSDIDMILNYMDLLKIKACCVSMDIETSNETMNLHQKSKNVLPFIGIHPEMAQKESESVYNLIEKNNKIIINKVSWNGLAKKSGIEIGDIISNFKVENLDRPNKAIVYPFSLLLLFGFGYLNYKRKEN